MSLTNEEIREALETCASEPVHIPGNTQPFACLVAVDAQTRHIQYVGSNSADFLGQDPEALMGVSLSDIIGRVAWHGMMNALSFNSSQAQLRPVGEFEVGGTTLMLHAYQSDQIIIVEFERADTDGLADASSMKTLTYLMQTIEDCTTEAALFETTVRLMRDLTQFDRVMVYRFDAEFNGEVLAEARRASLESFLNLRFPHWDIPAQARAIMAKIPLRIINDVDQVPVSLMAANADMGPLDISLAASRGVSPVHLDYLRNMNVKSSMTLSIKLDGQLWGIISFHHGRAHVPAASMRDVLTHFSKVFSSKLLLLRQKARLDLSFRVDGLKDEVAGQMGTRRGFDAFSATILNIMGADGLVIRYGDDFKTVGQVPDLSVLDHLRALAASETKPMSFSALGLQFPNLANSMNGCAGALVAAAEPDRTFFVFRNERAQEVTWAGNPEKEIEEHEGRKRISPRGSFSKYLSMVKGYATPWTDQDEYFAGRIWSLLNTVERHELISAMSRQQKIMIDELNHRVRNILALIRSISQQARQSSYGSLESYSNSLEARIQALAASHDLASGGLVGAVPVTDLISTEFEPYTTEANRLTISGTSKPLRADISPIFSLVIHELITNAVKYGALSNDTGQVEIHLVPAEGGLDITWREVDGPAFITPEVFGFGTALIREAVPYELGGEADLRFEPSGVLARFHLPDALFDENEIAKGPGRLMEQATLPQTKTLEARLADTTCWVVEDNFVIATGMRMQLTGFGVLNVETFSNAAAALDMLAEEQPSFALLDVNLGGGKTSLPVAEELVARGIPFLFVTGYGEITGDVEALKDTVTVTKPASDDSLLAAIAQILKVSEFANE